jgi:hypothetical protein
MLRPPGVDDHTARLMSAGLAAAAFIAICGFILRWWALDH